MIQIKDRDRLREICDKIKYVKDCSTNGQSFFFHLYAGMITGKILPFADYENGKMKGCLVLELGRDLSSDLVLSLIFVWIDKKYTKLWIEFVNFAEEKAKEFMANKILINTKRNAKAVERKLNKYGYNAKYTVFEKKVN